MSKSKAIEIPVNQCYLDCPDYYVEAGIDDGDHHIPHPQHSGYQRDTWSQNRPFCEKAAKNFHPAWFEPIHVTERPVKANGGALRYAIIDGGGRWYIGQLLKHKTMEARNHIDVKTLAEEAETFAGLNKNRRRVTPMQWFLQSIAAGNKVAIAIKTAVEEADFHIGSGKRGLSCLAGLEHAHKCAVLRPVLFHIRNCYGEIKMPNVFVGALTYIEAFARGDYDLKSYRGLLTGTSPKEVFTKISDDHQGHSPHPAFAPKLIALELARRYNHRKKMQRINLNELAQFCDEHPWRDVISQSPGSEKRKW